MTDASNTPDAGLHPRLTELVALATDVRAQLEAFVASAPPELHASRADANGWSVAEHLEHLVMIEDSIGRLISTMAKQLRASNAMDSATDSVLGSMDKFQLTANNVKLVAPEPYRPTGTLSAHDALEQLRAVRVRVLQGVQKASGLDLTQTRYPHPFFGPMDGYQWLLLIGQHEMRHLNQMKDVVQKLAVAPSGAAPASAPAASQESL